jgi:hypothetical protein
MNATRWLPRRGRAAASDSDAFYAIAVLMFVSTAIPLSIRRRTAPAAVTEPA